MVVKRRHGLIRTIKSCPVDLAKTTRTSQPPNCMLMYKWSNRTLHRRLSPSYDTGPNNNSNLSTKSAGSFDISLYDISNSSFSVETWSSVTFATGLTSPNFCDSVQLASFDPLESISSIMPKTSTTLDYTTPTLKSLSRDTVTLLGFVPRCNEISSNAISVNLEGSFREDFYTNSFDSVSILEEGNQARDITGILKVRYPWSVPTRLQTDTTLYPSTENSVAININKVVKKNVSFKQCKILTPMDFVMCSDKQDLIWDLIMIGNKVNRFDCLPIVRSM